MDKIIGRKAEQKQILESFGSDKSELVAVYGRHRVGKTFLIKRWCCLGIGSLDLREKIIRSLFSK